MSSLFCWLSEQDLADVCGGQFSIQDHGWKGGKLTTLGGNSVHVTPLHTGISINNNAANRLANGLNIIAAGSALSCPPVAMAAGIATSMVSFMNNGNGVNITIPHAIPAPLFTPRR
jgi:uncharacterized Zn-binding protein involved in type VI secretion